MALLSSLLILVSIDNVCVHGSEESYALGYVYSRILESWILIYIPSDPSRSTRHHDVLAMIDYNRNLFNHCANGTSYKSS